MDIREIKDKLNVDLVRIREESKSSTTEDIMSE